MTWLIDHAPALLSLAALVGMAFAAHGRFIRLETDVDWLKRALTDHGLAPRENNE